MTSDALLRLEERITMGIEVGESHFREFKSAWDRDTKSEPTPRNVKAVCKDIGEALVSFSNADGGELFVGVEDDGRITGVPHREALIEAIKRAHQNYVHVETPLLSPSIGDIVIEGQRVIYFSVPKSTDQIHLTSDGRCLRRFDKENRPIAFDNIIADREELASREYDRAFVDGVSTSDLDIDLLTVVSIY